jgi:hypothetical protein
MEGIDEKEAKELQKADEEVRYREASMRYCFFSYDFVVPFVYFSCYSRQLREEIERERRAQEIQLRELKSYVTQGGMNNSNSNTDFVNTTGAERSGMQANNSNTKISSNNNSKGTKR